MKSDAVVIGGGVVGLGAALTLIESGLEKVTLLENKVIASGGSGLGTGSVHTQRWYATDSDLIQRTRSIVKRLATTTNGVFDLYPVGRLTVVGGADGEIVSAYGRHLRTIGIDAVELSRNELKARFPEMNVTDIDRALFTREDGVLYPPALSWALAGFFRKAGGTIWEGCAATGLKIAGNRIRGVSLSNDDIIETDRVIVAAGVWSRKLLQTAGLDLALTHAVTHNSVMTIGRRDLWSQVPSLLDGVLGVIAIPRNPGTIMAANTAGEYQAPISRSENVMRSSTVELIERDEEFKAETLQQQASVLAQLRHRYSGYDIRGIVGHWAGLLDGTPDNHPLLGAFPGIDGLWVGCGLTGYGVQRGPGVGEALAHLALGKEPLVDVSAYAVGRFDDHEDFALDLSSDNPFEGFRNMGVHVPTS
ncbi:MAG: FAD-binding oxidoreductase [Geminicoccaceae bacterium]|nr:FAD-binding oxidoreductase [Geminicoccaceae bacterium]